MRPRFFGFLSRLKKRLKRSVVTTRPFPNVGARERRSQKKYASRRENGENFKAFSGIFYETLDGATVVSA